MAQCELSLHLEDQRDTYRPGDVARGYVEVRCDEDVRCDGLTVALRWRTHGRGTSVRETVASEVAFQGEWRAGAAQRYPFALEMPAGPFTYHGHYLSVVWEVVARADVPWAFDPETERELVLAPRPDAAPDWRTAAGDPTHLPPELQQTGGTDTTPQPSSPKQLTKAQAVGCLALLLIPLVSLLLYAVNRGLAYSRGEIPADQALGWLFATVVVLLFVGGGLFKVLRDVMAWGKVGQVRAEVEPRLVRAGESFRVKIFCQPRKEAELVAATVRVEAEEKVVRGSGTNKRSWKKVVHEQETEVAMGRKLARGLPFQTEGTVTIPEAVPPSFAARHNSLTWTVTVRLDLDRWPDWVEERTILVHP